MKRLSMLVVALFVMFGAIVNVNAMSESDLKAKLISNFTTYASNFDMTKSEAQNLADRYFSINEISSADADYISKVLDKAKEIVGNETNFKNLSASQKDQLISLANDITKNTKVKVTLTKNGSLTVYNTDGTVFTTLNKGKIEYTNSSAAILVLAFAALAVIGGVSKVAKKAL